MKLLTVLSLMVLLVAGCGERTGFFDLGETTEGERRSAQVQLTELEVFADEAATELIRDLAELPVLGLQTRNTPELGGASSEKPTIFIGDLSNDTDIVSTRDFEIVARKITGTLINSRVGRQQIRFIERSARVNAIAASEGILRDNPDLDPEMTYALSGNFYRTTRGGTNLYYLEFNLIQLGSGQIVFNNSYESKRVVDR
ncbi:hypothetical protein [Mucisphaera sp.]|uniref:hypothetical protein n=1 Tax=Mucisphaera sp. TaxID=2913024 RepID=UPI003D10875D